MQHSYAAAVGPKASSPSVSSFYVLPSFIGPEDSTSYHGQCYQISKPQAFCLEDPLEEGDIDDGHLSQQTSTDRKIENAIPGQSDLPSKNAFALTPACERIEHIVKHEACESHSSIASTDGLVIIHLVKVDTESSGHDYKGGSQGTFEQGPRKHPCGFRSRRPIHDGRIHGLHT